MVYSIEDLIRIQGDDHVCKIQMNRTKEIEEKYKKYKFNLEDFKKKLFQDSRYKWKLRFNDFPYDLPENINHLILWFDTPQVNLKVAAKIIKNLFPDNVIWFVNSPEIRSVNQLFHVHIFNNKLNI